MKNINRRFLEAASYQMSRVHKIADRVSAYQPAILKSLLIFAILLISVACSETMSDCELNNTGTIVFTNNHSNGYVNVFFNKTDPRPNNYDMQVGPNETQSMDLPAGNIDVKYYVVIVTCNNNRCLSDPGSLQETNINLAACRENTIIY